MSMDSGAGDGDGAAVGISQVSATLGRRQMAKRARWQVRITQAARGATRVTYEDDSFHGPQQQRPRRSTRSTSASSFALTVTMDFAPAVRIILKQFGTASARQVLEQIPTDARSASRKYSPRKAKARKHVSYQYWLPDERRRLHKLMENGASYAEAAESLGRTEGAVIQQ